MTLLERLGVARYSIPIASWRHTFLLAGGRVGVGRWGSGRRQARIIAAPLSHWLTPQWAPPPSERPLVSNCPPRTVSGTSPTIGQCHGGLRPSPSYIKGAWSWRERRWLLEGLLCHHIPLLAFQLKSLFLVPTVRVPRFTGLSRSEQDKFGLCNISTTEGEFPQRWVCGSCSAVFQNQCLLQHPWKSLFAVPILR